MSDSAEIKKMIPTVWIIWFFFLSGHAALFFIKSTLPIGEDPYEFSEMTAFFVIPVVPAIVSLVLWIKAKQKANQAMAEDDKKLFSTAFVFFIMAMALAESAAIMGFVASSMGDMEVREASHLISIAGLVLSLFYIPLNTFSGK